MLALGKLEQLCDGAALARPQTTGTPDDHEVTGKVVLAKNEPAWRGERPGDRPDDGLDGVANSDLQPVSFARPVRLLQALGDDAFKSMGLGRIVGHPLLSLVVVRGLR